MQDIFTQIRDLTSAIDEFGTRDSVYLQKPDEKTDEQEEKQPVLNVDKEEEDHIDAQRESSADEKTEQDGTDEKTLIEKIPLRFSDDFSELAGQFNVEEENNSSKTEQITRWETTQPSGASSTTSTTPVRTPAATPASVYVFTPVSKLPIPPTTPPHSRENRSRRTTLSSKSPRSFRRQSSDMPHKKKKQQENVSNQVYYPRSYSEMMRIPDLAERLSFYVKTYDLCMRADSKLKLLIKRMQEKGLPKPMTEGYHPPPRPASPEQTQSPMYYQQRSDTSFMNSSFSGSISMLLRKASMSSSRRTLIDTPKPSLTSRFTRSISRLTLSSRPTTRHPPRVAPFVEPHTVKRMPRASTGVPFQAKPPQPSPLVTEHHRLGRRLRSASIRQSSREIGSFTAQSKNSVNSPRESNSDPLGEMCNVLPQVDRRVLKEYLAEAGGDPMVAITLAVSQLKKLPPVTLSGRSSRRDQLLYGG